MNCFEKFEFEFEVGITRSNSEQIGLAIGVARKLNACPHLH
jgi:hypothetical protein